MLAGAVSRWGCCDMAELLAVVVLPPAPSKDRYGLRRTAPCVFMLFATNDTSRGHGASMEPSLRKGAAATLARLALPASSAALACLLPVLATSRPATSQRYYNVSHQLPWLFSPAKGLRRQPMHHPRTPQGRIGRTLSVSTALGSQKTRAPSSVALQLWPFAFLISETIGAALLEILKGADGRGPWSGATSAPVVVMCVCVSREKERARIDDVYDCCIYSMLVR
ncbi:hypothetical protein L7F22_008196 [Adiantum nelumboides]|nr:hypothetical protein [Adiantum nelumboides]